MCYLAAARDHVIQGAASMRAYLADPEQREWEDGLFVSTSAATIERQWRVYDPTVRTVLRERSQAHALSARKAKGAALGAAVWQFWTTAPLAELDRLHRRTIALAEADLQADAMGIRGGDRAKDADMHPDPSPDPLEALLVAETPSEPEVDLTAQLGDLPLAQAAFVAHCKQEPDLSNAERDRALRQQPGYSRKMQQRLRLRRRG